MTTHHWGTLIDPSHFVEVSPARLVTADDAAVLRVIGRPAAGTQLQVKSAPDLVDRAAITVDGSGYWSYTLDLADGATGAIYVSGDNWVTQVGPLYSAEAIAAGVNAGATAAAASTAVATLTPQVSTAVADSSYARARADYAVTQIGSGGGSFTGSVSWPSQVTDKPVIAPQSAITTPVSQSGTTYPTPAGAYGRWWFTGTADPTVQGIAPRNGDRWTKVKLA